MEPNDPKAAPDAAAQPQASSPSDNQPANQSGRPPWDNRLEAYLGVLRPLKEKNALREVVERELLQRFVAVNSGGISEYPMLETQQESIVNLLCRASGHPAEQVLRRLSANFPVLLNRLDKETAAGDEAAQQTTAQARNTESLLVKTVQGMVYAMGLTTDNFEELIMRHFGAPGLAQFSELLKTRQFDQGFWREFVERFIAQHIAEGFEHLSQQGKHHLSKDGQNVVLRYLFDDVLDTLHDSPGNIEQTRVQKAFAQASAQEPTRLAVRKLVQACLLKGLGFLPGELLLEHLESAALIVCMDPVAESLARAMQAKAKGEEPQEKHPLPFLMEQTVSLALGAILVLGQSREHFLSALAGLRADELDSVRSLAQGLSMDALQNVLFFLLESSFVGLLREKAREEGGKVTVKTAALRRAPLPAVDALSARGLTRIRKSQLFTPDPTRPDMLLFKVRTTQQLASLVQVLQLEEPLQASIRTLWEHAPWRRDFLVVIDLAQVARTTQNVKGKLSELLHKFGAMSQAASPPVPPGAQPAPE